MRRPVDNKFMPSNRSAKSIISKTSRLTKKNPEQEPPKPELPYFKEDPMRSQIFLRVSQTKNAKENKHLDKASHIISDLMDRHHRAKEKLQRLKQEAQKQYDKMCPFTPSKHNNQRYTVTGDVVRRNEVWLREKKRKQLELREQVTNNSLRECTFSPTFSSKKQSANYLRSRDMSRSMTPKASTTLRSPRNLQTLKTHGNVSKRDFTQAQYEMAKRSLINRMMGAIH